MRRHPFFRDAMHFLRSNLYFQGLSAMQHRGVQRLVQIWARHGDVILKSSRHRMPDVMHYSKSCITIALAVCNYAYCKQVINLLQFSFLTDQFAVQRIKSLNTSFQLGGDSALYLFGVDSLLHFFHEFPVDSGLVSNFLLESQEGFGLQKEVADKADIHRKFLEE